MSGLTGHTPLKFVPKHLRSKRAINKATSEQLVDLMALCHEEPADFDNCLACYAYKVAQDRETAHYAAAMGDQSAAELLRLLGMPNGEFLRTLAERLRAFGGPEVSLEELDRLDQMAAQMLNAEKYKDDPR